MLQRRNVIHYIKMEQSPTTTTESPPPPPEGVAPAQKKANEKANDAAAVVALPSVYYKDKKRKRALRAGDPDVWEVVKQLSKAFYDANPGIDRAGKRACNHVCTLCWKTLKVHRRTRRRWMPFCTSAWCLLAGSFASGGRLRLLGTCLTWPLTQEHLLALSLPPASVSVSTLVAR